MNYPKVLYKGDHYEDFQQMTRDVHTNKLEHRYVSTEEEEIQAMEDGFAPLGNFIGTPHVEKMKKRRDAN